MDLASVLDSGNAGIFAVATHARGPEGALPVTEAMLLEQPSGNLFGLTQNAWMGWEPAAQGGKQVLILSTHGGVRAPDGTPRHHLLDPATGVPAWTGVIAATALGATAVDAEIDAKAALLAGATGAIRLLRGIGGAVVLEGEERVRLVGLAPAPITVRVPHRAAA